MLVLISKERLEPFFFSPLTFSELKRGTNSHKPYFFQKTVLPPRDENENNDEASGGELKLPAVVDMLVGEGAGGEDNHNGGDFETETV